MRIRIGSRTSTLALKQSEEVKQALLKVDPTLEIEIVGYSSKGDLNKTSPLETMENGIFTSVLEKALVNHEIDLAVHSLKDMPANICKGLILTDTIKCNDYRDVILFKEKNMTFNNLKPGAIVATCSKRRAYALTKLRPDLKIVPIRGNIETRLEKLQSENIDAIILAAAALNRLGLEDKIGEYFDETSMIPSPTQGILGLEVCENSPLISLIHKIRDEKTCKRMALERLFLKTLNGSCHDAIGCYIKEENASIVIDCMYGDNHQVTYHHEVIKDHIEERIIEIAQDLKRKIHG